MNIDELIAQLTAIKAEHGNLDVFDGELNAIHAVNVNTNEDTPSEYGMPELFVQFPYYG